MVRTAAESSRRPSEGQGDIQVRLFRAADYQNWLKKRGLLKPVEVIEPDYVASDDPRLLKSRIRELEKRLKRSETEKEILKKATAYFASQSP